jgi:hypothetical protein
MEVGVAATKDVRSHDGHFTARKPKQYLQTSEDGLLQNDGRALISEYRKPVRSTYLVSHDEDIFLAFEFHDHWF